MAFKKLPIGEQSFRKIREEGMLYVDKTADIHRMVTGGQYLFLSRPRRFGKSLTLSTIEQLFLGERRVYNPFSILQLFDHRSFEDYWFKTGTPTFLLKHIKERGLFRLNDLTVSKSLFESFDLENLDIRSLLFQTGYLTIRHIDTRRGAYTLDYPNREVEESMHYLY